jgi:hypothetical protein
MGGEDEVDIVEDMGGEDDMFKDKKRLGRWR